MELKKRECERFSSIMSTSEKVGARSLCSGPVVTGSKVHLHSGPVFIPLARSSESSLDWKFGLKLLLY